MRIVYVLSGSRFRDGSTKSFLVLLRAVIAAGHECFVILPGKGSLYDYLKKSNINVRYLSYRFNAIDLKRNGKVSFFNWLKWKRRQVINHLASRKLLKLCRQFSPDLIHSNTSANNIGYIAAKKLNIVHITHFREYGELDFAKKITNLDKQLAYKRNYSISITKGIAEYRSLSKLTSKVIYNGILDEKDLRFTELKENYILYVGRIQETKGVRDLICAYINYTKSLDNPLCLYLAGDYNFHEGERLKNEFALMLANENLTENVKWLGEVSEIQDYMYKAMVTVVPSKYEGFGRVMPEAMLNGSLVIGRNSGGTKEQFDNGLELTGEEIGLRFHNVDELTNHLTGINAYTMSDYISMICRSQQVIKSLYTKKNYSESILRLYDDLISHNYNYEY